MEINAVDGGGDEILQTGLSPTGGGQSISWKPTRTNMKPAAPMIPGAELVSENDMVEGVNTLLVWLVVSIVTKKRDQSVVYVPHHTS